MDAQTGAYPDVAEVDDVLAEDVDAVHNRLIDAAGKYSGDGQVREIARFAAREVAVRFCPRGEEFSCHIKGSTCWTCDDKLYSVPEAVPLH